MLIELFSVIKKLIHKFRRQKKEFRVKRDQQKNLQEFVNLHKKCPSKMVRFSSIKTLPNTYKNLFKTYNLKWKYTTEKLDRFTFQQLRCDIYTKMPKSINCDWYLTRYLLGFVYWKKIFMLWSYFRLQWVT